MAKDGQGWPRTAKDGQGRRTLKRILLLKLDVVSFLSSVWFVIVIIDPFTPKILLHILLTICHVILMMLVWRI